MGHAYNLLVDGQHLEHRGVAAAGAAPERHHDAGGDFGGGGRHVDGRKPRPRRVRARRPAARLRSGHRPAVPGRVAVDSLRLDAAEALRESLSTASTSRSPRSGRSVAVQEFPGNGWEIRADGGKRAKL